VLRENKPGDGTSSLGLLNNDKSVAKHGRKASWASSGEGHSSLEGTEPDHASAINILPLQRVASAATGTTANSPTHTHVENFPDRSRSRSRSMKKDSADSDGITAISGHSPEHTRLEDGKEAAEEPSNTRVDLEQDSSDVDPTPFAFKPYTLASMLDPKNLDILEELGGIQGLLKGLGTNRIRGIGGNALTKIVSSGSRRSQGVKEPSTLPGIVVTAPGELESGKGHGDDDGDENDDDPVWSVTLEQRRQVYGQNVLPHRPSKSLLALMWLALKDKVLVRDFRAQSCQYVKFSDMYRSSCLLLQ